MTAQHRELLDSVLRLFNLIPDYDLDIMEPDQPLEAITATILRKFADVLDHARPDVVLVHGDTTTAMSAALGAFYRKIPVAHVEAGLRSGKMDAPWPEELNRRIITLATEFHFAPTENARANLLTEGIADQKIFVTGNTVVDALKFVWNRIENGDGHTNRFLEAFNYLNSAKKLILVTGHRRENFGPGISAICEAIVRLAKQEDVEIIYPVHPNPNVRYEVYGRLLDQPGVFLIEPLEYESFVYLMGRASLIITDSGGVQEEAPSLGKPVLVCREVTERPEAVLAGGAQLVGCDADRIVREAELLLRRDSAASLWRPSLYGDGQASERIRAILERELA